MVKAAKSFTPPSYRGFPVLFGDRRLENSQRADGGLNGKKDGEQDQSFDQASTSDAKPPMLNTESTNGA
jgi:hypothetical protein